MIFISIAALAIVALGILGLGFILGLLVCSYYDSELIKKLMEEKK